jgi:rare lipoprotein A
VKIQVKPQSSFLATLLALLTIVVTVSPGLLASQTTAKSSSRRHDVHPGATLTGKATYYPNSLNGHKTSSGEIFHQSDNTAASNMLPLGTDVEVTNLKNGKTTDVTITDRGRKLRNHEVDLSKTAASEIGLTHREGTAPVKMKVTRTAGGKVPSGSSQ